MKHVHLLLFVLALILLSCQSRTSEIDYGNPPAEGFDLTNSDTEAIALADKVMDAIGGRKAWDTTRYVSWTFFGRRHHVWDKQDKMSRIEVPSEDLVMIVDLKNKTGKVRKTGIEMTNPDSLEVYIDRGYKMWVNDSYWLLMPFKLKDSGVTLKYAGKDTTMAGQMADVLELTFANVGVTPDNKYLVYVNKESNLVDQWDYYANYEDSTARFQSPWPEYKKYGDLLLSGGQIGGNQLTDISVSQTIAPGMFSDW